MNRREAIKKLGAGGAIFVAPLVIPSFSVAHAASPLPNTSPVPPPAPQLIAVNRSNPTKLQFNLNTSLVTCAGAPAVATVQWKVLSFVAEDHKSTLNISGASPSDRVVVATSTSTPTSFFPGPSSVQVSRNGQSQPVGFVIVARVTWTCGGSSITAADYTISKNAMSPSINLSMSPPM
jgi:hypothetical protein